MTDKKFIEPDKALVDIKHDALGVADLAKRIASSIIHMTSNEGLVIGLYGAWGSGKTTFINFVKQSLSDHNDKDQPFVLNFNPWLFSSHEDLIQKYIIELSKALTPKRYKIWQYRFWFIGKVENYSVVSRELLVFAALLHANPLLAGSVKVLNLLSRKAKRDLAKQPPLAKQKEKIARLLIHSKRKILVIIDDIDRLEAREIMDIFRLVKSVADFPNVIYLLSFDKKLIVNIVKDFQNADGSHYLEKIVQYDVDLPYPDSSGILTLFGERIDPTIEAAGGKKWDKDRWSKLYNDYLKDRIRTPRQAVRLSSAYNIAYPALKGEVDPVDFLAIEALRMFHLDVFYEVRRNPHRFTELGQDEFDVDKTDPPYFEKILNLVEEKERGAVKECLELLFPRVENAFSNFKSGTNEVSEWRAQARVCSSNHFGRYFSYSIMLGQFSDSEIYEAVKLTADIVQFENLIVGYSKQILKLGKSRIPDFLERFLDVVKAGQADNHLQDIIKDFLILGDLIVREEDEDRASFIRVETDMRVLWIVHAILQRMPQGEIFKILKTAFQDTKSIHIPVRLFLYLGREHGLYGKEKRESLRPGENPYLTIEQIKELETIVLSKIRAASKDDSLLENSKLPSILYRWRDIVGNFDEQKSWAQRIVQSDDSLKKFLVRFARVSVISNMKGTIEKTHLEADNVADFLDLDATQIRVKTFLDTNNLSLKEKTIFEAFMQSYENKKNGKSNDYD